MFILILRKHFVLTLKSLINIMPCVTTLLKMKLNLFIHILKALNDAIEPVS